MIALDTRTARVLWTVIVFAVALGAVYLLHRVVLLLAFSLVFAYLVFPLVRLAESWGPLRRRRAAAILLVYLVLLSALTAIGFAVGPRLTADTTALARKIPAMSADVQSGELLGRILERRGWDTERIRQVDEFIRAHTGSLVGYAQKAATAVLTWLTGAWVVVLIPIFAFFFLKDGDRFTAAVEGVIEHRPGRALWRGVVEDVHHLLGEYVRALIALCVITFVVWAALFLLAGMPYAILLAVLGGALEFIPVVGPVVAGVVVVAVNLFAGYGHPLLLVGFLVAWRLIQDYVTSPLVMGSGVELHPALVIFGVIAGGEIGGVAGMFLSIPVMAAIRIVWRRYHAIHHATTGTPHGDAPARPPSPFGSVEPGAGRPRAAEGRRRRDDA